MTLPRRSLPLLSCIAGHVLLATLVVSTEAPARAWAVLADGSGDAPTIQAAVDSCSAGDSVLVGAGAFFESVEIDVPIAIIGAGAEVSRRCASALWMAR